MWAVFEWSFLYFFSDICGKTCWQFLLLFHPWYFCFAQVARHSLYSGQCSLPLSYLIYGRIHGKNGPLFFLWCNRYITRVAIEKQARLHKTHAEVTVHKSALRAKHANIHVFSCYLWQNPSTNYTILTSTYYNLTRWERESAATLEKVLLFSLLEIVLFCFCIFASFWLFKHLLVMKSTL